MNTALRITIDEAFFRARKALNEEAPTEAFSWLERAHILSQRMPILHAQSHWLMLRAGWQLREQGDERLLLHGKVAVLRVLQNGPVRWLGHIEIENLRQGYRLQIDSVIAP